MASVEHLLEITGTVAAVTDQKIDRIHGITRRSRMLALNASIEAQRVGQLGRGFAVVADEVKAISTEIAELTDSLRGELRGKLDSLSGFGRALAEEVRQVRGERLADLAHNAVEIADRNLYERSCDVRWWATDSAVVDCLTDPDQVAHACKRLGVILDSYTVYLDLWVADSSGRIIANGRPGRYPSAIGTDVSRQAWFRDAMATSSGNDFAVADISREGGLGGALVATYATAIREGGEADGKPIGALGIFFDWEAQAQTIVDGVRLSPQEKLKSRCMLIDRDHRIIADSARRGLLVEKFPLRTKQGDRGCYQDMDNTIVAYALTPGYETYQGLGWYGVIVQEE
ncbi:methyl-accepting chemotaxis protein [Magnetospirillum sulfuroxidans]|uniref:Chemotaxis protein n=1 Tax=Magnetospirillum sulfuroxidans TaxID=611300 RepID=A0ABS5IBR2_9PROT|nr:methyl-accepting chemotaxis protein [Magnetospirillum sulfuroxidans]MBR9971716.1 chemotaxis protein [Magnetospirillum sulfuroxidans]